MNENTEKTEENKEKPVYKPNEQGGVYFSSFVKISDPNTGEVLVQQRGDD
jgi:hypothetical protein